MQHKIDVLRWRAKHDVTSTEAEKKKKYYDYIDHYKRAMKDPVKYLYLDKNGRATDWGVKIYKDMVRESMSGEQSRKNSDELYNAMSFNIATGTPEYDLATSLFAGTNDKNNNGQYNNQFKDSRQIQFGNTNLTLTAIRTRRVAGREVKSNQMTRKLQEYLRKYKIHGFTVDQQLRGAMIPTQSGRQFDVTGTIYLPNEQISRIKKVVCGGDAGKFQELMNAVGATETTMPFSKKSGQYATTADDNESVNVIAIPVTRTISNADGRTFK